MAACSFRAGLWNRDMTVNDRDGSGGKREIGGRSSVCVGLCGRPVRISGAAVSGGMPNILGLSESGYVYGAGERCCGFSLGIVKGNVQCIRVLLIFVDDQQGPLSIGPQHGISRHKRVARSVADVAGGRKQLVSAVAGLDPLQIEQLANEILRQRLTNLEFLIGGEKAKRSGRTVVPAADRFGHVMKIVDRAAAAAQKRADVIGQPQSTPDIHERFRGSRTKI